MNKNASILASVAVTFAAVAAAGSWVWWKSHTPKALARELVISQLKDPGAVRFASVRMDPGSEAVCGLLQARNGAGQYVRKSSFVVLPGGQLWVEPANSAEDSLTKVELLSAEQKQTFTKLKAELCPELQPSGLFNF